MGSLSVWGATWPPWAHACALHAQQSKEWRITSLHSCHVWGSSGPGACIPASVLGHSLPSESAITWGWRRGWPGLSACPLPGHTQAGHLIRLSPAPHAQWKRRAVTKCVRIYTTKWWCFPFPEIVQHSYQCRAMGRTPPWMLSYSAGPSILTEMRSYEHAVILPAAPWEATFLLSAPRVSRAT